MQSAKESHLLVLVFGISVSFICLSAPFVWNVLRQLSMNYSSRIILQAKDSGAGVIFNYEYHIVVFILSINNCVNFYIYVLCGKSWRKKFKRFLLGIGNRITGKLKA